MRKHKFLFLFYVVACLFMAISCSSTPDEPTDPNTPDNGDNTGSGSGDNGSGDNNSGSGAGQVLFYDDFEGGSNIPDTTKWVLCERSTSNWARYLSESYDQAYQENGSLYLVGEKSGDSYLTGGIETRGKFEFQYGKVECRARFVRQPKGNHTGIWMMPAPPAEKWPKSGEIDIMEHLGDDNIVYETVHSWYLDDMDVKNPTGQTTVAIDNTEWNTYGVTWTPDSITYTVNGQSYLSYPNLHLADAENAAYQWPFNHPFYLILSQSLGGAGTWAGPIDNAALPAVFEIDWIKVTSLD